MKRDDDRAPQKTELKPAQCQGREVSLSQPVSAENVWVSERQCANTV